jgi:7-cyano-7-deazaguanine synthase
VRAGSDIPEKVRHSPKALLVPLLSGGLDSAVATVKAREDYGVRRIEAIFVDWGQTAVESERRAFGRCCTVLDVPSEQRRQLQISRDWRVPSGWTEGRPPFPVARNLMLLSLAIASAASRFPGSEAIVIAGFTKEDRATDTREGFVDSLNRAAELALDAGAGLDKPVVVTPLRELTKADAIRWALARNMDALLAATWTCWNAGETPCGQCDACKLRNAAFLVARAKDPAQPV